MSRSLACDTSAGFVGFPGRMSPALSRASSRRASRSDWSFSKVFSVQPRRPLTPFESPPVAEGPGAERTTPTTSRAD